jgi:hypothetical protein
MAGIKKSVRALIAKARESAMLAVNIYNSPGTVFRSGAFIVLMNIAWTSLIQAIFERDGVKYFYKDPKDRRKYLYIDNERKAWDLSRSGDEYFKDKNTAIYKNMKFFIGLRNKIEHSFMPEIDANIFGECQAYLINLEEVLVREFGERHSLADSLLFALQYSRFRSPDQIRALKKVQSRQYQSIKSYIDEFRNDLDQATLSSPNYSFRVFLIQKPANRESTADATMEFVQFNPENPKEMERYKHLVTLIREKQIPSNETQIVARNKRLLFVDRGKVKDGQTVGITSDPKKASGVLVIERLSDEILEDVFAAIEAAKIQKRKYGDIPVRMLYSIYAEREKVSDRDSAKFLLESSCTAYTPFCYWLLKVSPEEAKRFLMSAADQKLHNWNRGIFRLFTALESDKWEKYGLEILNGMKPRPLFHWRFNKILEEKEKHLGIFATTGFTQSNQILGYTVQDLIEDDSLACKVLSELCLIMGKAGTGKKLMINMVDLIAYAKKLTSFLPDP